MIFFTTKKVIFVGAFLAFALGTSADEVCHSKCGQQFKEKVGVIYDMATGVKLRSIKDILKNTSNILKKIVKRHLANAVQNV